MSFHEKYSFGNRVDEQCSDLERYGQTFHNTKVDTNVQKNHLDKEPNFSFDVDRPVRSSLKKLVEDGADAVCGLTGMKDVQTQLGPVPVSKTLTVSPSILDMIVTQMWTL